MITLEINLRKKAGYVFQIFLDVFHPRLVKSVLKRCVRFCLMASLIAYVHAKVRSLSKSSWLMQLITEHSHRLGIQLKFALFVTYARHGFTWITEVETTNAHDVWE